MESELVNKDLEIWDAGSGYAYLYTTDVALVNELAVDFPRYTVYFRSTRPSAWQFCIPRRVASLVMKRQKAVEIAGRNCEIFGIDKQGVIAAMETNNNAGTLIPVHTPNDLRLITP